MGDDAGEKELPLWRYFRTYYGVNRQTWPSMSRRAAALDAARLTWKIRRFR